MVFENEEHIPSTYSCDGANLNPPLVFIDVPKTAQSLALIMYDPDALAGSWTHWTVWNIKPETKEIMENSVPQGAVEGITNFGKTGYGGPCPPEGRHRYIFRLYALDQMLNLSPSTDRMALENAMKGHVLEWNELTGIYER